MLLLPCWSAGTARLLVLLVCYCPAYRTGPAAVLLGPAARTRKRLALLHRRTHESRLTTNLYQSTTLPFNSHPTAAS